MAGLTLSLMNATPAQAQEYELQVGEQQITGPAKPDDAGAWRTAMTKWRDEERERIDYDPANYERPELAWAQRNPIQPQVMVEARKLYDHKTRRYTVDRYLADVQKRYGGIDSVLIWPTYPNIGADDRNTEQMFRAMPGGWSGVKRMVEDFHRRDVHVLFPIMVWDLGTRDPGAPWAEILPEMMEDAGADGLNGDTMNAVTEDYFDNSLQRKHPLVLEPELGMGGGGWTNLAWNTQSWGYWDYTSYIPKVSVNKWLEPRHTVHVNDRWSKSKIDMLQAAFFNGTGLESWENIWSIWNQLTERDGEAIRRVAYLERRFPELLVSADWEPHTPTVQRDAVFASRWPGAHGQTLWTLVNRGTRDTSGDQITVPYDPSVRYYDVWNGVELTPRVDGDEATFAFPIEGKGFGAVLASGDRDLPKGFTAYQRTMHAWAQRPLASYSADNTVLRQRMTPIDPTSRRSHAPDGMVEIPGGAYTFGVRGTAIEGGDMPGVDVQYPWEEQPGRYHSRAMEVKPFYLDRTPVTNARFARFLDDTGYRPPDGANFLKSWNWRDRRHPAYPKGWADKPVTWVSIEDARAYADWAGRRLPNEWEWQYAAQGHDSRNYPWGNAWDASPVPETFTGRGPLPAPADVDAHPEGASPFGALDMVGNVWQWTNEFTDVHTRSAVLRGGSYYRAQGSHWYFPSDEDAYRLDHHNKYLLMAPGRDRAATIGFRTAADAREAGPGDVDDGRVVDDDAAGWRFTGWPRYTHADAYSESAHGNGGSHGQSAEYTFTGTGVDVYGWRGPNGGTVRILVDGKAVGDPESQHATTDRYHQLLGRIGGLAPGEHTVRIETDEATAADQWTMVDYLRVYGEGDAQPPAPPALSLDDEVVAAGTTVTAKATFRNESARTVTGRLGLSAAAPLKVTPAPQPFRLAPHAEVTETFRVTVPEGVPRGGRLLRAVAALDGAVDAEGWSEGADERAGGAGRDATGTTQDRVAARAGGERGSGRAEGWNTVAVLGSVDPVTAKGGRANDVDLSWAPVDPEGRARYEVHASTTRDFTPSSDTLVATTGATTYEHGGLGTEETWYYRVRATGGAGASGPYSTQASATTGSVMAVEAEALVPPTEATAPSPTRCVRVNGGDGHR